MNEAIRQRGIPAKVVHQEMNEEAARLPEASTARIEAALETLGNELARRSAIIELAGQTDENHIVALNALAWVEWTLKGTLEEDDYVGLAINVRDSFDRFLAAKEARTE